MKRWLLVMTLLAAPNLWGQAWSGILDPSRAIDWSPVGALAPQNYTVACTTQPTLLTGSGNASANAMAIASAISGCDHNVVNLPVGTFYSAGINFGGKSNVVVRGAGANSTYIFLTPPAGGCLGYPSVGICMGGSAENSGNTGDVNPPSGSNQCLWTAGFAQGATSITLNSCGGALPAIGNAIILDQADETTDNGGIAPCSTFDPAWICSQKGNASPANADGRVISGTQYSQQQVTRITSISGSGTYTVGISPGVYFNNIRIGQTPGAWWATTNAFNEGVENMTLDHSTDTVSHAGGAMVWCNSCWFTGNRSLYGLTNHISSITSFGDIFQNNYFYGSQHSGSNSYAVQFLEVSDSVVQNNIMQNTTSPTIQDAVSGSVIAYNFTPFINFGIFLQGMYASHNSGTAFNLMEGNATTDFLADDVWGTSFLVTEFRNHSVGWQPTYTRQTNAIYINTYDRAFNIIGNVLGQPGYHAHYEAYATSATAGVGAATVDTSIYSLGWTDTGGSGVCTNPPGTSNTFNTTNDGCDPAVRATLMRWGNYDTVNNTVRFDNTESSPGAVAFVNAQSTPGSHTLPASFYLASKPSWFGSLPYPSTGPDVTGGTTGICTSGPFSGVWATASSQCAGGGFTPSAWAGHTNANPAMICYLVVMLGPPDGSGGPLAFNPNTCYAGGPPPSGFVNYGGIFTPIP